jgi:hypothetical protein
LFGDVLDCLMNLVVRKEQLFHAQDYSKGAEPIKGRYPENSSAFLVQTGYWTKLDAMYILHRILFGPTP